MSFLNIKHKFAYRTSVVFLETKHDDVSHFFAHPNVETHSNRNHVVRSTGSYQKATENRGDGIHHASSHPRASLLPTPKVRAKGFEVSYLPFECGATREGWIAE